ncbi:S8 family serine peptidase [Paenarthrobacter ureafaciens]|uniref:S8 family serine peptidase n=1 Tax=Paenarthrobacter ureafaciens TaxID=37931 RepID=UPI003CF7BE27
MADHLNLMPGIPLSSKRSEGYNAEKAKPDRARQATTLAGILAGLSINGSAVFDTAEPAAEVDEDDDPLGRLVLKFAGRAAFATGAFGGFDMTPLGANEQNQFFVLSDKESRRLVGNLILRYADGEQDWDDHKSWQKLLDNIEGVEVYGRDDRADPSLSSLDFTSYEVVDVILWPTSLAADSIATRRAPGRVAEIRELIDAAAAVDSSIRVLAVDDRPDTLLIRVATNQQLLDELLDHPLVEKVRGPLKPLIGRSDYINAPRPQVEASPSGAPIGVVDDLVVTGNPWLQGVVTHSAAFPVNHAYGLPTKHGTQVAGIAAYGSLSKLLSSGDLPRPNPIIAARVMESDQFGNPTVVGPPALTIEAALRWVAAQGAKVIVCSIAYPHADDDPIPSELTAVVDQLSRELQVVVVLASGNVSSIPTGLHWFKDYPHYLNESGSRVAAPGGAALAVTVGAFSEADVPDVNAGGTRLPIAQARQIAPFSRTGPTRGSSKSGTRKPEFVAPGGNWVWDEKLGSYPPDLSVSVVTLEPPQAGNSRVAGFSNGTSLAAPYVAHEIAQISTRYPSASPNLLRALTALSCVANTHPDSSEVLDRVGTVAAAYGLPDASRVLESGGNRTILTFQGAIKTNSRIVHRLPIPEEFAAAGAYERHFRVALAFDPPVRRSRKDYIAGKMHFEFVRSHSLEEVIATYEAQPSAEEMESDANLKKLDLPKGRTRPDMSPPRTKLSSNTLIRRDFSGAWLPEDEDYFLIVFHDHSPWSESQKRAYETQDYALGIELLDSSRLDLDLHSLVEVELRAQGRQRGRLRL